MFVNENFQKLSESYLFAEVGKRVRHYQSEHPEAKIIRMDIGDVTLPIAKAVAEAMRKAVEEMLDPATFRGYGPEQGYDFLRKAIADNDYRALGIEIEADDIFISDGAKCDIGNLTDIFDEGCVVGISDPVYPVYIDSNVMAGRNIDNGRIRLINCDKGNGYKPQIPDFKVDVIYLCSPNNPTGTVLNKEELKQWVNYAKENESIILFDSAYECFVRTEDLPRSIYEISGAKEVAIEIRSFSKTAGFTGLRCGYTVVPNELKAKFSHGETVEIKKLWLRRQTTKFNGASYIIQRGAEAVYSKEGKEEIKRNIDYYLNNARLLRKGLEDLGYDVTGGENSPYVWFSDKDCKDSWELFEKFLTDYNISTTPGVGFGEGGQGCLRLTGFNSLENTLKAVERLKERRTNRVL